MTNHGGGDGGDSSLAGIDVDYGTITAALACLPRSSVVRLLELGLDPAGIPTAVSASDEIPPGLAAAFAANPPTEEEQAARANLQPDDVLNDARPLAPLPRRLTRVSVAFRQGCLCAEEWNYASVVVVVWDGARKRGGGVGACA